MLQFKDLKKNYPIFILDREELVLIQGKVVNDVLPSRYDMTVRQNVVDINVDSNGKILPYIVPENATVSSSKEGIVIAVEIESIIREVEAIKNEAERQIADYDRQKERLQKATDLLEKSNPAFREKQETDRRFRDMETKMKEMYEMMKIQQETMKSQQEMISGFIKEFKG